MNWRYRITMSGVVAALYLLSLLLPAYDIFIFRNSTSPDATVPGWWCVLMGIIIVMLPPSKADNGLASLQNLLGWTPNPLLLIGLVLLACASARIARWACLLGILGLLGTLVWLYDDKVEAIHLTRLYSGYYVWVLSMLLLSLCGFIRLVHAWTYETGALNSDADGQLHQDDDE